MPIIKWSEQLSVKISLFDQEHKNLIGIINKLFDAMSKGEGHKELDTILDELISYTITHFKHEEEALQKYNFPGLAEQKKQHEAFVKKIEDTKKEYDGGAIALTMPLIDFLTSWIQNHILKTDSGYSEFLLKAGLK